MRSFGDPPRSQDRVFSFNVTSMKILSLFEQVWTESKRLKYLELQLSMKPERFHYFEGILNVMSANPPRTMESLKIILGHMNRWRPDILHNCPELIALLGKVQNLQHLELRWYEIQTTDPHPLSPALVSGVAEMGSLESLTLRVSGILQQWSCISMDFAPGTLRIWRSPGYDHNLHDNFTELVRFMRSFHREKARLMERDYHLGFLKLERLELDEVSGRNLSMTVLSFFPCLRRFEFKFCSFCLIRNFIRSILTVFASEKQPTDIRLECVQKNEPEKGMLRKCREFLVGFNRSAIDFENFSVHFGLKTGAPEVVTKEEDFLERVFVGRRGSALVTMDVRFINVASIHTGKG